MIIAFRNFQDWEFSKPKEIFEKFNIQIDVASTQKGLAKGTFGLDYKVSLILEEIIPKIKEYDAIIFVGGAGTPIIRKKKETILIAENAYKLNKIIGAICWAPTILAKSGILKNKKATCWLGFDSEYNANTDKVLEQYGCDYSKDFVVVDKNIVTAEGPMHAEKFANEILKLLHATEGEKH